MKFNWRIQSGLVTTLTGTVTALWTVLVTMQPLKLTSNIINITLQKAFEIIDFIRHAFPL
jgi:hypothetical protein